MTADAVRSSDWSSAVCSSDLQLPRGRTWTYPSWFGFWPYRDGGASPIGAAMTISLFELFKIGVGPSSSHTVGPMVAARRFAEWLDTRDLLGRTAHVEADLYGSLALTGKGNEIGRAHV